MPPNIVSLVDEWKYNPFYPENQDLQTLQTGAYASEELVNDFESAQRRCTCSRFFFLSNDFHVLQTSATNKMKMRMQYKI